MDSIEILGLVLGACAILTSGVVWMYWTRRVDAVRAAPRQTRRSGLDAAVTQTIRLLVCVMALMSGGVSVFLLTTSSVLPERAPCALTSLVVIGLLSWAVQRAILERMRDDLLSRWALEDRQRIADASDAESCPRSTGE